MVMAMLAVGSALIEMCLIGGLWLERTEDHTDDAFSGRCPAIPD